MYPFLWYYLLISYDINVSLEGKLYDMYGFNIILNNVKRYVNKQ